MITLADIRSNATETSLFLCFRQRNRTLNIRAKTRFRVGNLKFQNDLSVQIAHFRFFSWFLFFVCISCFNFRLPGSFDIMLHCYVNNTSCSTIVLFLVNALSKSRELRVALLCAILRFCLLYRVGKIMESRSTTDGLHYIKTKYCISTEGLNLF